MIRVSPFLALTLVGCVASGQFEGPGFQDGELLTDAEAPFVAVATRAIIASGMRSTFNEHVGLITDQMDEMEGCVGYELRGRIPGREVWTVSVWESEEAMFDFVTTGAHAAAMPLAGDLVAEFDSAQFDVEADELPLPWSVMEDELDAGPAPVAY